MAFKDKETAMAIVKHYNIRHNVRMRVYKNEADKYIAYCLNNGCPWRVRVTRLKTRVDDVFCPGQNRLGLQKPIKSLESPSIVLGWVRSKTCNSGLRQHRDLRRVQESVTSEEGYSAPLRPKLVPKGFYYLKRISKKG